MAAPSADAGGKICTTPACQVPADGKAYHTVGHHVCELHAHAAAHAIHAGQQRL